MTAAPSGNTASIVTAVRGATQSRVLTDGAGHKQVSAGEKCETRAEPRTRRSSRLRPLGDGVHSDYNYRA